MVIRDVAVCTAMVLCCVGCRSRTWTLLDSRDVEMGGYLGMSADGERVYLGDPAGHIVSLHIATGDRDTLGERRIAGAVAVLNGQYVLAEFNGGLAQFPLSGRGEVPVWLTGIAGATNGHVAFAAHGRYAAVGLDGPGVARVDLGAPERSIVLTLPHTDPEAPNVCGSVSISADASVVACATENRIFVFDCMTEQVVLSIATPHAYGSPLCLTPDGLRLIAATRPSTLSVFCVASGELVCEHSLNGHWITAVALAADGHLGVGLGGGGIAVCRPCTSETQYIVDTGGRGGTALTGIMAFTSDGALVALSSDGRIRRFERGD